MKNEDRETSLLFRIEPLITASAEGYDGLEWIERNNSLQLVVSSFSEKSEPVLGFYTADPQPSRDPDHVLTLPAQFSRPQWNVCTEADASLSIALTKPGSMICPLVMWNTVSKEETTLSTQYPIGIFSSPHFVKRVRAHLPPIAAVASLGGSTAAVLFVRPDPDGAWDCRILYQPESGYVQQAQAVQFEDGYLLFCKVFVPGSVEIDSVGGIPTLPHAHFGTVSQGIIHCVQLDRDFKIDGTTFRPLGDELYFEFDVDAVGDRVVILGTTDTGIAISEGRIEGESFHRTARIDRHLPAPLSEPSVMIGKHDLYVAVLESPGTPEARVLFARQRLHR